MALSEHWVSWSSHISLCLCLVWRLLILWNKGKYFKYQKFTGVEKLVKAKCCPVHLTGCVNIYKEEMEMPFLPNFAITLGTSVFPMFQTPALGDFNMDTGGPCPTSHSSHLPTTAPHPQAQSVPSWHSQPRDAAGPHPMPPISSSVWTHPQAGQAVLGFLSSAQLLSHNGEKSHYLPVLWHI